MTRLAICATTACFSRSHFTGKERDAESGNDYFGARYYGSSMGRFLTPDWSSNPVSIPFVRLDNPQTLNRYSYVGNNPLNRFDRYGHLDCSGGATQDVACLVQAGWNALKNFFSGGGSNSSNNSSPGSVTVSDSVSFQGQNLGSAQQPQRFTFQPRAPDYYNFNAQLGFANPSVQYVPSTHNWFLNGGLAAPKASTPSVTLTAGWSLSNRPEDYLGGKGVAGCGSIGVAACVGYSPGGAGWAFEAGIGTPGYSFSASYAYDWNSYLGDVYQSLPVENPNGAVGIGSGLSYNPCMDDANCQY
jgi:RHS repeat-associated protein